MDTPSEEVLRGVYSQVLKAYGYRCAMTNEEFAPSEQFLRDDAHVIPIRPLSMGGSIHVDNCLCLNKAAAMAFSAGHVGIGRAHGLLVDLSRIDPELLEAFHPLGRLLVPNPELANPDPGALAFHREHIFLG